MASYTDEADAEEAGAGIADRLSALEPDNLYADSTVSVEGRVVVIVTPAQDFPRTWSTLRNLLLTAALLD